MKMEAFKIILQKYVQGEATPLEEAIVKKWYEALYHTPVDLDKDEDFIGEEIYNKIREKINQKPVTKIPPLAWIYKAAAILIVTLGGFFVYQRLMQPKKIVATNNIIKPGEERALLKMSDGSEMILDSTTTGTHQLANGVKITRLADGTLVYDNKLATGYNDVQYNEMHVPAGGKYKLQLPDGSLVWLNSVSTLKFPTRFTSAERKVFLTGEAYFEIKHNSSMPFLVDVPGRQSVKVLGTHFNISAYEDEAEVKTTLVQGKVEINTAGHRTAVLAPGQQSIVQKGPNIETRSDVNMEEVLAWKDGYFLFKNTNLTEIVRQISRWYDVQIELDPGLNSKTFSGKLPQKEEVGKLLKMLEATNLLSCEVNGKKIKIRSKNKV